ncbi:MAG: hypothetical protein LUC60_04350 [Lachnospiraceae bacterium]|nr:hypothetical protein [Lachnospiraceae bacterium]
MNTPEWFYDERVQKIAPEKLKLLMSLAQQLEGKSSQKEMLPVLMGAAVSASRRGLNFTREEFDLIFRIMKEGKSAEEQAQMDRTLEQAQQLFSKR